jgi:hypothetical protein
VLGHATWTGPQGTLTWPSPKGTPTKMLREISPAIRSLAFSRAAILSFLSATTSNPLELVEPSRWPPRSILLLAHHPINVPRLAARHHHAIPSEGTLATVASKSAEEGSGNFGFCASILKSWQVSTLIGWIGFLAH